MQMELSSEEALWRDYHADPSDTNRNRLAEHCRGIVVDVAKKMFATLPEDRLLFFEDLLSFGEFGLLEAIEKFDESRGLKFVTLATRLIRGRILDGLRDFDWAPRKGRQQGGYTDPRTGVFHELPKVRHISSFRARHESGNGRERCPIDQLHSYTDPDRLEARDLVKRALVGLSQTERIIVLSYYCLDQTMKQIGESLNLSESRVSQMMTSIKSRMRERWPNGPDGDE